MPGTIEAFVPMQSFATTQSRQWRFQHGNTFQCNMECMQCMAQMGNRRCSRKSCYTIPYCWQHLKLLAHLRVGRTTLKDPTTHSRFPFRGLFACDAKNRGGIVFRARDVITPYIGEVLRKSDVDARYGSGDEVAPYAIDVGMNGDDVVIDGACIRGVASLANDATPGSLCINQRRCRTNAKFWSDVDNFPTLMATRTIRDGDEIFVSYGEEYWDGIHMPHTTSPESVYARLEYKC